MVQKSQRPIRVAQVVGKMVGGGVESVVMNYYRHIDRNKVQFDFLVDSDSTLVPRSEIEALGGRVFVIPPYQHQIAYQRKLSILFSSEKWPIVHSHINTLSVFPLAAAKREGIVVRIAHSHSTAGKGEYVRNVMKYALRLVANLYPTERLACSRYAGQWLFRNAPFHVMPNAFDIRSFSFNADKRHAMRRLLGIDDSAFVIGHVGRFTQQKNQLGLISSFSNTDLARRRNTYLVLAGQGPDLAACKSLASELGVSDHVIFAGQQSDMPAFYSALDVFVLPSRYEGLGLVLIEAQASGLPCIASPAVPRESNLSGQVKYLTENNERAWTKAISCASPSSSRTLNEKQRASLRPYDIEQAAPRLVAYYQRLISGSRSFMHSEGVIF